MDFTDDDEDDVPDSEETEIETDSEYFNTPWISHFCSLQRHGFFCHVDEKFIKDDFNLTDLETQVPSYEYCLRMILDLEPRYCFDVTRERNQLQNSRADKLYGLIHARYILSIAGMAAMLQKFRQQEFGVCPRVGCKNQSCLPVGESDVYGESNVKIFCPSCEDIYFPKKRFEGFVDGACFGTTFPHLFLMTYPNLKPQKSSQKYVPKIFGFKIHNNAQQEEQSSARTIP